MIDMDTLNNIRECLAHTESAYQNGCSTSLTRMGEIAKTAEDWLKGRVIRKATYFTNKNLSEIEKTKICWGGDSEVIETGRRAMANIFTAVDAIKDELEASLNSAFPDTEIKVVTTLEDQSPSFARFLCINVREEIFYRDSSLFRSTTYKAKSTFLSDVVPLRIETTGRITTSGDAHIQANLQHAMRTARNLLDEMEDTINRIGVVLPNREKRLFDLLDTVLTNDKLLRPTSKTRQWEDIDKRPSTFSPADTDSMGFCPACE